MFFLDAFYFMIVTSSTIGFGDISPYKVYARFIVLIIILSVLAYFAEKISALAQIISETN